MVAVSMPRMIMTAPSRVPPAHGTLHRGRSCHPARAHGTDVEDAVVVAGTKCDADLEVVGWKRGCGDVTPFDDSGGPIVDQLAETEVDDLLQPTHAVHVDV